MTLIFVLEGSLSVIPSAEQTKPGVRYKEPKSGRGRMWRCPPPSLTSCGHGASSRRGSCFGLACPHRGDVDLVPPLLGAGIQPNSLTHEFLKAIDATSLPRVRFHDLRHAHATHMLAAGLHPKVASERLGHSKVGITLDLNSHVLPGMQADAVSLVDAAFRAARSARTT